MKRQTKELFGEILEKVREQNKLLEQILKTQILIAQNQNCRFDAILKRVKDWHNDDNKHHAQELKKDVEKIKIMQRA